MKVMEVFTFKNLLVWQKSMGFASKVLDITNSINGHYRLMEQLEASASSVPQNTCPMK